MFLQPLTDEMYIFTKPWGLFMGPMGFYVFPPPVKSVIIYYLMIYAPLVS